MRRAIQRLIEDPLSEELWRANGPRAMSVRPADGELVPMLPMNLAPQRSVSSVRVLTPRRRVAHEPRAESTSGDLSNRAGAQVIGAH
ncbi:MAG: hypothetical protein ACLTKG_04950 [Collinsella intestinalis]